MGNILQSYLDKGMLHIAEDEDKFKHLQRAAQEVAKKLAKKKTEIINHTLVALDPSISTDDSILVEVEGSLKKYWGTYRNRFPDSPRQLLRPIIFEALRMTGEADPVAAAVVWLTGGSYLPHADLGNEHELCERFLTKMGDIAEAQSADEWVVKQSGSSIQLPNLEFGNAIISAVGFNKDNLETKLFAASGPTDAAGTAIGTKANQYTPDIGQSWTNTFVPQASQAIALGVTAVSKAIAENVSQAIMQIKEDVSEHVSSVQRHRQRNRQ